MLVNRPYPRFDAVPDRGHAHAVVHAVALSQTHGTARRRLQVRPQQWPTALEAEYAKALVALVARARAAFERVTRELPKLLAKAQASSPLPRMDAADSMDLERRTFAGLDVVVENATGTTRTWVDSDGTVGHTLMKYPYGYIDHGAVGADGEPVDVYLGGDPNSHWVFAIHQQSKSSGFTAYDEDKVMLGFANARDAELAYRSQYDDPRFFGGMSTMSLADFKAALERGGKIAHRADAGETDFARRLIDQAEAEMRRDLDPSEIEQLATYFARKTSQVQRAALSRQLTQALGVEVLPDDQHIPALLDYFTHENATLIGSIPEELHQEVAKLTARAFTKRMNPETFSSLLEDRFGVAESRARFIARDQLGKLWGQINAVRQRSIGVDEFTWMSLDDGKVRPKHLSAHGKTYSYESPPPVGRYGERYLPGEDYGCRCQAMPVVSKILEAAKTLRGHSRPVK